MLQLMHHLLKKKLFDLYDLSFPFHMLEYRWDTELPPCPTVKMIQEQQD